MEFSDDGRIAENNCAERQHELSHVCEDAINCPGGAVFRIIHFGTRKNLVKLPGWTIPGLLTPNYFPIAQQVNIERVGSSESACERVYDEDQHDARFDLHAGAKRVDYDHKAVEGNYR